MKRSRLLASAAVLALTICVFIYYATKHPKVIRQLGTVNPLYLVLILFIYLIFTALLSIITKISVQLSDKEISALESFKLTSSSALANFFGPLQSGPGVRAIYLKKKHDVSIKKYGLATLYYYGFYAVFSGLFLLSGDAHWRLPIGLLVILGALGTGYILLRRSKKIQSGATPRQLVLLLRLALITFLQLSCTVVIYFIELTNLGVHVSLGQVLSYSGAANFALFVSLTPGAIGFREAFLVFSERLHHVPSNVIVSANIIDRGIYVSFLALLFIWLGITHTKKQIDLSRLSRQK